MHNDLGNQLSLSDIIDQFISAMLEHGIETTDEIVADGEFHRFHVVGDSRGSKNGFYRLHADYPPNGLFGCNKRYGNKDFKWKPDQKTAPLTPAQRKEFAEKVANQRREREAAKKERRERAAAKANALWNKSQTAPNDHPYLVSKGVKAHGLRVGIWEKFDQDTGEVKLISDNALLVPLCDRTRAIHSLQAITPEKMEDLHGGNKDYFPGGAKRGLFHTIGTKPLFHDGKPVFIQTEGYATGASIHECTGHLVLVCFDAGNLPVVAKEIHDRMVSLGKEAIILQAADNDRWTTKPINNPGVHYAKEARDAVGDMGRIAIPEFKDLSGEPTDFNDLHQREGAEAVVNAIAAALNPPAKEQADDAPWGDEPVQATAPQPEKAPEQTAKPEKPSAPATDDNIEDELSNNGHFSILGYDQDNYFFFHHGKMQILVRTARAFSDVGLIELAPVNWWEESFPAANGGIDKKAACNWLFRTADARGIYDTDRVRGRGAWMDKGRSVFHHGDRLTVDGQEVGITRIKSSYVYPMAKSMPEPAAAMLTAEEGAHLVKVAEMIRWSMPSSAALLAGWVMLAPICGALRWRPHIWLTGAAGTGKSTVQRDFCGALTRGFNIYAQGESTEAGIRQKIQGDARPVLMDEAESNDEKSKGRMDAILATIRQASTESQAETLKGTISGNSMNFRIRSMFCLASINTNLDKKADIDRLCKLTVRPPARDGSSEAHWKILEAELYKIANEDGLSSKVLARGLGLMPVIIKNIEIFSRVAAHRFGSQREGDQLGTLLAGAWSMGHDEVATDEQAKAMIDSYDWKEHTEDNDQDDAERALGDVLDAKIRVGSIGELSVYELIRECSTPHRLGTLQAKDADAALRRHGIRVEIRDSLLLFGTSVKTLKELVVKSSYATDLRGQLLRLPGADRRDNKPLKFNGRNSKVVAIPLAPILEGEASSSDEPPI